MKSKWFLLVIAASGGLLLTQRTFAEPVAYDNTATYAGTSGDASNIRLGSEITLAGTQRVVRAVTIAVEAEGKGPAAFSARLALHLNDGPYEGSPGTLLWQGDLIGQQIGPGGPRFIRFTVPGVPVPDTLIWVVGFGDWQTPIRLSQFYPPTVGNVRLGYWRDSLGPIPWLFSEDVLPFGAKVTVDPPIPAVSEWGALLLMLTLMSAGAVIIIRANRRRSTARTVGGAALLPALSFFAWASPALGQVQVGPWVHIDVNGGTAAANETSIASSNSNPNEIVASWNDWRQSDFRELSRMGVAVSNNGGATWTDFLVRPPQAYQSQYEGDPMTAYDDRTGTLWVGAISFASNGGVFVARKIPGQPAFEPSVMASLTGFTDKGWMSAGSAPGNPNATDLYIAYGGGGFSFSGQFQCHP